MDADVCYIGYYFAWAGYQNFLRSELSLGDMQLYMPKQLKVTNDFDFYQLKFPYEEDMPVSTFAKIPKDKHMTFVCPVHCDKQQAYSPISSVNTALVQLSCCVTDIVDAVETLFFINSDDRH